MPCYRIISDVFARSQECAGIEDPHLGETFLPDRRMKAKFPPCPERKTALDELYRPFDRQTAFDRE